MKLWHAVVAALGAGLLAQVLSFFAASLTFSLASTSADPGVSQEELFNTLPVIGPAMFVSSATLLLVALLVPRARGLSVRSALAMRPASGTVYVATAVGTLALVPVADVFMSWTAELVPDRFQLESLERLHALARSVSPLGLWPLLALMPGLSEEILFRGMVQQAAPRGLHAILVSGFCFAVFHLDPPHIAGVLPLGLFFAWVVERTGSVWVTVVAHVINNTVSIAATRIEALDVGYGSEAAMPWQWVPAGLALAALCVLVILRATREPFDFGSDAAPGAPPAGPWAERN